MSLWVKIANFFKNLFSSKPSEDRRELPSGEVISINKGNTFPDISHHESCDFSKFKGKDMIFKATEHVGHIDRTLAKNLANCKAKGIRYGVYHYYRVGYDPISQAKHFIETVELDNLKSCFHLPVVDYETIGNFSSKRLKKAIPDLKVFIRYINKQTGRKMRIYTGDYLLGYLELDDSFLSICDAPWVARYYGTDKKPQNSSPWPEIWAHQFSDKEPCEGIGECDMNIFY